MNTERGKRIHLRPRLQKAAELLGCWDRAADIGCDHGRLSAALLQSGQCGRVIASDVSPDSLQKACQLRAQLGLEQRMELRLGSGFSVLQTGEVQSAVLAGMGGTLMCQLLEACTEPLQGASLAVFQPMRGQDDIRQYLYERNYVILRDCVVRDAGRLYQVFSARPARPGERVSVPDGWPKDCFEVGYTALLQRDPLLPVLAGQMLCLHEQNLARADGPGKEILEHKAENMRQVIGLCQEENI